MKFVKDFPTDKLKLFKGNPRRHGEADVSAVVRSIEVYGWTNPILAQSGTNRVLAGHGRIEAARRIDRKTVPVVFLEMTDKDADAYTIADNRLAELSEWDIPSLKDLMAELDSTSYDLSLTGFDRKEIEGIFAFDPSPAKPATEPEKTGKAENRSVICPRCKHEFEV